MSYVKNIHLCIIPIVFKYSISILFLKISILKVDIFQTWACALSEARRQEVRSCLNSRWLGMESKNKCTSSRGKGGRDAHSL